MGEKKKRVCFQPQSTSNTNQTSYSSSTSEEKRRHKRIPSNQQDDSLAKLNCGTNGASSRNVGEVVEMDEEF